MPQILKHNEIVSQELSLTDAKPQPTIALLPCCDLFEDFFDTIGMSLETYCNELTGGWQFNYIESLQLVGVRTVIFFFSARVSETTRFLHVPTGATICVLPPSRIYRAYRTVRRQAGNIWKRLKGKPTEVNAAGSIQVNSLQTTRPSLLGALKNGVMSFGSYLSTPLGLLIHELRSENCDAILCQDYEYARFDVCVLLGKFMRLPVFATFQGGDKLPSLFEYPFRWLSLRASSGLIIASQIERQRVLAFYRVPPTKLVPIFNPMDVTTWRARDRDEARAELGIPSDAQVVAYHGRIQIWQKGLDILLQAWDQICRERPGKDLRLLLVGTGSDADELHRRIAAMQLKGVVWIDEYVRDRSAIQRYLSSADVYTLPSRKEGFPVAPIEAMACNLPVVAADVAGISDILQNGEASGGLIVPRENAKALALALGCVLDDEAWGRELGKRARLRAEECFSFEVIGKQLRDTLLN
ncbi:MAG: glycosyltransferase family 4 protein [Nostoc sp.]|uniref:glycosyltransferase family 4 protein n=1 Tax=unclassified Nostoc TaxID=2593658 RepID=UPI001E0476BE|nr:glycosyltransferase family 4 protein [Nostoc sp. JL23]MBN3878590.1 glycosyltransferase family 4 protein [Nostoc sp. JL23]